MGGDMIQAPPSTQGTLLDTESTLKSSYHSKFKISSPFNFEHKSKLTSPKLDIFNFENGNSNHNRKSSGSSVPKSSPVVLISKKSFIVDSNVEIKEGDLLFLKSELSDESILVQPILKVSNPFWISIDDVSKFEVEKDSLKQYNNSILKQNQYSQEHNFQNQELRSSHTPSASVSSKSKLDSTTPTSLFSKQSFNSSVSGTSPNADYVISQTRHEKEDGSRRTVSCASESSSNLSSTSPTKISLKSQIHPLLTKRQLDNCSIEIRSYSLHKSRYWYRVDLVNPNTNSRIYLSRYYQDFYDLHISGVLSQKTFNQSKAPKLPEPFSFERETDNDDALIVERCRELEIYLNKLVRLTDKNECLVNPIIKWLDPKETDLVLNANNFHLSSKIINESLNTLKDRQTSNLSTKQANRNSSSPLPSPRSSSFLPPKESKHDKQHKKYQDIFIPRPYPSFLKKYDNISPTNESSGYYSEGGVSSRDSQFGYTTSSSSGSNSSFRLSKHSTHSYSNSNTSSFESGDDKRIPEESFMELKQSQFDEPTKPLFITSNTNKPRYHSTGHLSKTSAHRTALLPTLNISESTINDTKSGLSSPRKISGFSGATSSGKSTSLPNSPLVFQGNVFSNDKSRKLSSTSLSTNSTAVSTPDHQNLIKFKIMHKDNNGEIVTVKLYYSNVNLNVLRSTIKREFGFEGEPALKFKNFKTGVFVNIKSDVDLLVFINDQFYMYSKILIKFT